MLFTQTTKEGAVDVSEKNQGDGLHRPGWWTDEQMAIFR